MNTLEELDDSYRDCQRCSLWHSRRQIVFGIGNPQATLLVLAERPGGQDDVTGVPFSGPSGDLLEKILAAPKVEVPKSDVYITNMVLCRAPEDRSPLAAEIKACSDRLHEHIRLVNPKLIAALGRLPMIYFLGVRGQLEAQRGWHKTLVRGKVVPVYLTFNPASALYGSEAEIKSKKRAMYDDWQKLAEKYRELIE
jgi:DNA polymerase